MTLTRIIYNAETIGAVYAPSLNAAFKEIFEDSGIKPIVKVPYGGARTPAEQAIINPGQIESDHVKQRAVDIFNQRAIRDKIGSFRFEAILAKHGWHNIQVNGQPFPIEPWHFANHSSSPIQGEAELITLNRKGKDMILLYGPDTGTVAKPGPKVFVVASRGIWDRYSASFSKSLGSQFGSAVELSLASMLAKKELYLGPTDGRVG